MKIINKFLSKISSQNKYSIGLSHILNFRVKYPKIKNINDLDFKIFSQNGEDGIIDYLLHSLKIDKPKFIEIGVGDYTECNTRFLFERCSPKGLIIDCLKDLEKKISKNIKLWRADLTILEKMISPDNINVILKKFNFHNKVDLFSLDIDGIDYWVLKELPKNFSKIAVIEFNSNFGYKKEISVPLIKNFDRTKYHYSNLCYGASLKAIINLMKKKGFVFIGTNLHRVNAFFVQKKLLKKINLNLNSKNLKNNTDSNIRESRDKKNKLTYLTSKKKIKIIGNCKVIDVSKKKYKTQLLKDLI
tara:strand:+ start:108 stop:1013 length:906 start_codon:yes stop_codon:yes gene_type:complete